MAPSSPPVLPTSTAPRIRRREFRIWNAFRFRIPPRAVDALVSVLGCIMDSAIYILGPILICFALVIAGGLTYTFFSVLLPMIQRAHQDSPYLNLVLVAHTTFVLTTLVNVMFNYFLCVTTSNKGPHYERVVRELAEVTDTQYPETPEEVEQFQRDYQERMLFRLERRQARAAAAASAVTPVSPVNSNSGNVTQRRNAPASPVPAAAAAATATSASTVPRPRAWMIMGPHEWGFCTYTRQPKPPRSHYDHVTKLLVLNMDHYCPWMFNTIGYFNYRYFCNFLGFVFIAMFYGVIMTFQSFRAIGGVLYWDQIKHSRKANGGDSYIVSKLNVQHINPWVPVPHERSAITFAFMLCLSVGLAVFALFAFHMYLVLTAQTTIEFHGNYAHKRRAKRQKRTWVNPYDLGWKRNWQQVYGAGRHPLLAVLLPSTREPEFLPVPLAGEKGKRKTKHNKSDDAGKELNGNRGGGEQVV